MNLNPALKSSNSIAFVPGFSPALNISDFLSIWLENALLEPQHQKIFDDYYRSYSNFFGKRMRFVYSEQIKEAVQIIRTRPGARVLEVGYGLGTESLWLAMQGANVLAIDVVSEFKETAQRRKDILEHHLGRSIACEFRRRSIVDMGKNTFDLVWMEQTFHHLEPRDVAVENIVSVTKPGGHIVISESNALNPLIQTQLFLMRGRDMYFTHTDHDGTQTVMGRERILTARKLNRLFKRYHVNCKHIRYFRIFPNRKIFDGLLYLEKLFARQWLAPLMTHYNYVGQRLK